MYDHPQLATARTDAAQRQAAIVQGAALRGLEGTAPRKRIIRRHYGVPLIMNFREGIDPESRAVWNRIDGVKRCINRVDWMISKVLLPKSMQAFANPVRARLSKVLRVESRSLCWTKHNTNA